MNVNDILTQLEIKLGVTPYGLNRRLGLKSSSHIYHLKTGLRTPNIHTWKKIIKLCKEAGLPIDWNTIE